MKYGKLLLTVLAATSLSACASSHYSRGVSALDREDYDAAVSHLLAAYMEHPTEAHVYRDLGIAYFNKDEYRRAGLSLRKAERISPYDPETIFYLGALHERSGNYDQALHYYELYGQLDGPAESMKEAVNGRIQLLKRKVVRMKARERMASEDQITARDLSDNGLAVLYFKNESGSPDLQAFQKGLADLIIRDFSAVQALQVPSRGVLQGYAEEVGLDQYGLAQAGSEARMGKLLGVRRVVYGTYRGAGPENLHLEVNVLDVASQTPVFQNTFTGSFDNFYGLVEQMVFDVTNGMDIMLSDVEQMAISTPPTTDRLAFMAYSRGLDYQDQGLLQEASSAFTSALSFDPGFGLALQRQNAIVQMSVASQDIVTYYVHVPQGHALGKTGNRRRDALRKRLVRSGARTGVGFVMASERRKPTQELARAALLNLYVPFPGERDAMLNFNFPLPGEDDALLDIIINLP